MSFDSIFYIIIDTKRYLPFIIHYREGTVQFMKSSDFIQEKAAAKINLALAVGNRREDGYHDIDTVMHSISLADCVEIRPSDRIDVTVEGAELPQGPDNLAYAAASLFFKETGKGGGASIRLEKHIPVAAGLGGGSSDAAAVLRGLNCMTGAGLSAGRLRELGARLGSDIPFCIEGGCARCMGRGEEIHPVPFWDELSLVICRPDFPLNTPEAYKEADRRPGRALLHAGRMEEAVRLRDGEYLASSLFNDFESFLFPITPALKETKIYLRQWGCPVLMTGSGSAFFLLVQDMEAAAETAEKIRARRPDWFAQAARTMGDVSHDA